MNLKNILGQVEMKIYLAASAPRNETVRERGMLDIHNRLLSYYHIIKKQFECDQIFKTIIKEKKNG